MRRLISARCSNSLRGRGGSGWMCVEAVDDYPAFLPWCGGVQTLERNADTALVRIDIAFHGVRTHFTTANAYHRPDRIVLALRDGPFRRLDGVWTFHPLAENACKVEL